MKGVKVFPILLPKDEYNLTNWSVIACDQFTSQPSYWEELDRTVGEVSTLRIIYPECFLGEGDEEKVIQKINDTMADYLDRGIFKSVNDYILTVRTTSYGRERTGLVMAVDLDCYDYTRKDTLIRATEKVVEERLPARVKIRENAPVELPHVLLLIDDEKQSVIKPFAEKKESLEKLYDFELNQKGGHICGYRVDAKEVEEKLSALLNPQRLKERYNSDTPFLFAVGDGNHSLAAAKKCWENIKPQLSAEERENHPARYCLVEVDNIHEEDMNFEPIHRVVMGMGDDFIPNLEKTLKGEGEVELIFRGEHRFISVAKEPALAIKELQEFIDDYIKNHDDVSQDYVHGTEHSVSVAEKEDGICILFPSLSKDTLFRYISENGTLCRKSFSMGEAEEKRYYLEAKLIK